MEERIRSSLKKMFFRSIYLQWHLDFLELDLMKITFNVRLTMYFTSFMKVVVIIAILLKRKHL